MATKAAELYEEDFYAWTRDQAASLRRMARDRWNGPLDLEHLAEEIEDVGSERRDAVRSQLRRIIEHLLKLEHSQARDPRGGWRDSILDARAEIPDRMTATIRREVEDELPRLYSRARAKAANGLSAHGERDAAWALPDDCPYRFDDLLTDDWYPPNRYGIGGETE
jgi:DNA-binding PucR family transcriptional regulator